MKNSFDSNLTVCLICTNADTAGAPLHVLALVRYLKHKFKFHCIFGETGPVERQLRESGVDVSVIPELRSTIKPFQDFQAWRKLQALVKKIQPRLIHAHSSKAGMLGRLIGWQLKIPCIYTVHGWGFGKGRPRLQSFLVEKVERFLGYFCQDSRYIFVCHADQIQALHGIGVSKNRGQVIWNAVEDHGCRADPGASQSIMMAARVTHAKDHVTLLRAFNRAEFGHLFLAGEGTDSPEFNRKIIDNAPRRSKAITSLGRRDDVAQLMGTSAVFALSSRYEGLPLSIVEAMCAGLPIIATNVGGNPELIEHGKNGFLVAVGDIDGWQSAIDALADPSIRTGMGLESRARYERYFTPGTLISSVAAEYKLAMTSVNSIQR